MAESRILYGMAGKLLWSWWVILGREFCIERGEQGSCSAFEACQCPQIMAQRLFIQRSFFEFIVVAF